MFIEFLSYLWPRVDLLDLDILNVSISSSIPIFSSPEEENFDKYLFIGTSFHEIREIGGNERYILQMVKDINLYGVYWLIPDDPWDFVGCLWKGFGFLQ